MSRDSVRLAMEVVRRGTVGVFFSGVLALLLHGLGGALPFAFFLVVAHADIRVGCGAIAGGTEEGGDAEEDGDDGYYYCEQIRIHLEGLLTSSAITV